MHHYALVCEASFVHPLTWIFNPRATWMFKGSNYRNPHSAGIPYFPTRWTAPPLGGTQRGVFGDHTILVGKNISLKSSEMYFK